MFRTMLEARVLIAMFVATVVDHFTQVIQNVPDSACSVLHALAP